MAKETLGKTVKQLKQERTLAKSAFTKQANYLSKAAAGMIKHELQEEFSKLSSLARNVSDANEDYAAGLLAEAGTKEEEKVKLDKHQQADLESTIEECNMKLEDIHEAVQFNLWSRYGKEEVDFAIQEAEKACDRAREIPVTAINRDGYELQLERARKLIHDAGESLKDWEKWIPHGETADLKGRVKKSENIRQQPRGQKGRIPHRTENCRRGKKTYRASTNSSSTTSGENKANQST